LNRYNTLLIYAQSSKVVDLFIEFRYIFLAGLVFSKFAWWCTKTPSTVTHNTE